MNILTKNERIIVSTDHIIQDEATSKNHFRSNTKCNLFKKIVQ